MPIVGQAEGEGRFRTLLSVFSDFATLNFRTDVMQRSVRVGELYSGYSVAVISYCGEGLRRTI